MRAQARRCRFAGAAARQRAEFQFGQRGRGLSRPVLEQRIQTWSFLADARIALFASFTTKVKVVTKLGVDSRKELPNALRSVGIEPVPL